MKKQLTYILFTCIIFGSCKKHELPKPDEEEVSAPVFYFKGNVNGVPVKIEAGVDNYVMSASHYQDAHNLYVYKGELKQSACPGTCGFALSVMINDYQLSELNAAMKTELGLTSGNYVFNDGSLDEVLYKGTFEVPDKLKNAFTTYLWKIDQGANYASDSITKMLEAGHHSVKLTAIDDNNGLTNELTKDFIVGNPLQANIDMVFDSTTGESKFSTNPGGPTYKYLWDFGDKTPKSMQAAPAHPFSPNPNYDYTTTLTMVNSNNDTCVTKYRILAATDPNPNYVSRFEPYLNPKVLSAITVVFTDQNGITYSSADLKQSANSMFEITSVENYKPNQNKEATKKIKLRFSCSFTSASGPVNITDGEAVIAVSYK